MATLKSSTKKVTPKTNKKVDRLYISSEPWEINRIRVIFHKFKGDEIIHPTIPEVKALKKKYNDLRRMVYRDLKADNYIMTRFKQ